MSPIRRSVQLQGPRPAALDVSRSSETVKKGVGKGRRSPVIVYLQSPTVIHVKPQDFRRLVQRLTGNKSSMAASCSPSSTAVD